LIQDLIETVYSKKGRIYKNQKIGSGRIVFALGEGLGGEVGADLTLYAKNTMYTLFIPDISRSYKHEIQWT